MEVHFKILIVTCQQQIWQLTKTSQDNMVHKRYFGESRHIKDIFIRIIIHISIYQYMYIKSRKGCRRKIQKVSRIVMKQILKAWLIWYDNRNCGFYSESQSVKWWQSFYLINLTPNICTKTTKDLFRNSVKPFTLKPLINNNDIQNINWCYAFNYKNIYYENHNY